MLIKEEVRDELNMLIIPRIWVIIVGWRYIHSGYMNVDSHLLRPATMGYKCKQFWLQTYVAGPTPTATSY